MEAALDFLSRRPYRTRLKGRTGDPERRSGKCVGMPPHRLVNRIGITWGKITFWLRVGPSGSGADPELKRFVNFRKNI